jgi:hypothetical protein
LVFFRKSNFLTIDCTLPNCFWWYFSVGLSCWYQSMSDLISEWYQESSLTEKFLILSVKIIEMCNEWIPHRRKRLVVEENTVYRQRLSTNTWRAGYT